MTNAECRSANVEARISNIECRMPSERMMGDERYEMRNEKPIGRGLRFII